MPSTGGVSGKRLAPVERGTIRSRIGSGGGSLVSPKAWKEPLTEEGDRSMTKHVPGHGTSGCRSASSSRCRKEQRGAATSGAAAAGVPWSGSTRSIDSRMRRRAPRWRPLPGTLALLVSTSCSGGLHGGMPGVLGTIADGFNGSVVPPGHHDVMLWRCRGAYRGAAVVQAAMGWTFLGVLPTAATSTSDSRPRSPKNSSAREAPSTIPARAAASRAARR